MLCTYINKVYSLLGVVTWVDSVDSQVTIYDCAGLEHCKYVLPLFHEYLPMRR